MQGPLSAAQRQQRLFGLDTAKSGSAKGLGSSAVQARGLGIAAPGSQIRQPLAIRLAGLLQEIAKEHLSKPPSATPGARPVLPCIWFFCTMFEVQGSHGKTCCSTRMPYGVVLGLQV